MAKKYYGIYSKAAAQALKSALNKSIFCETTEAGDIFVTNGYILLKMTGPEYDEIVRPLTGRDPGTWCHKDGEITEQPPRWSKAFTDSITEQTARDTWSRLEVFPGLLTYEKGFLRPCYNPAAQNVYVYNNALLDIFNVPVQIYAAGCVNPAFCYIDEDRPVAMILPVRGNPEQLARFLRYFEKDDASKEQEQAASARAALETENTRLLQKVRSLEESISAIQAAHEIEKDRAGAPSAGAGELEQTIKAKSEQIETLTAMLNDARGINDDLEQQIEQKDRKIAKMHDEKQAIMEEADHLRARIAELGSRPAAGPSASFSARVQAVVDSFSAIAGAVVTVKGAASTAPVVWITGEDRDAIQAAGGVWSAKRGAFWCKA